MANTKIHIHQGNDRERLSAGKLDRLLNWMRLAQTPSPTQRLSAEQLSELLAQVKVTPTIADGGLGGQPTI